MKNSEYKLKDLLDAYAGQTKVHDKLIGKRLEVIWFKSYEQIKVYTDKLVYKNGVLTVWLNSSLLKVELSYNKKKIIQEMNHQLGEDLVKSLLFK